MDQARWVRIEAVFHQATRVATGPGRVALVQSLCDRDESLAADVLALLEEDDRLFSDVAAADPHVGLRLERFEIDELIARGGMAAVYRAHRADDQFQQRVAVKIMDVRLSDPVLVAQFRAERQLDEAGMTCNKNGIPFDPEKPFVTSGIRLGSAALTTRGFDGAAFAEVGQLIIRILDAAEQGSGEIVQR